MLDRRLKNLAFMSTQVVVLVEDVNNAVEEPKKRKKSWIPTKRWTITNPVCLIWTPGQAHLSSITPHAMQKIYQILNLL